MFPWDKTERKPRSPPFGDLDSFLNGFESFFEDFDRFGKGFFEHEPKQGSKNFVWGFSSVTGPDGVPHIREYSNIPGFKGISKGLCQDGSCKVGSPNMLADSKDLPVKPYYDIFSEDGKIKVVVDLPGVEKNDIKLRAKGTKIVLMAENEARNYHAEIDLGTHIAKDPERASYKNGILELVYQSETGGSDIHIN